MAWFTRQQPARQPGATEVDQHRVRTEGLWLKCESCRQIVWRKALEDNLQVCPKCEYHYRIDASTRLRQLFDDGKWEEFDRGLASNDPLEFVDQRPYKDRLAAMKQATSLEDALISATGMLKGRKVGICALELKFIGGSMGAVLGEQSCSRASSSSSSILRPPRRSALKSRPCCSPKPTR